MRGWTMQKPGVSRSLFWGSWFDKSLFCCVEKSHIVTCLQLSASHRDTPALFFPLKKHSYGTSSFFFFFFSFLRGLFYKKVPVSWGPSGTYYGSLVVINHGRVSISTQCLPQVSNSHSLTVSSTVAFLSICPLFSVAPTWTLWNWSFSCWHVCFLFVCFSFLFFSCVT